jgi:hypothetical protein
MWHLARDEESRDDLHEQHVSTPRGVKRSLKPVFNARNYTGMYVTRLVELELECNIEQRRNCSFFVLQVLSDQSYNFL